MAPSVNIQNLMTERQELVDLIDAIHVQLANRDRTVDGRRMTNEEYQNWRARAVSKLKHTERRLRQVNHSLKENNRARDSFNLVHVRDAINAILTTAVNADQMRRGMTLIVQRIEEALGRG